MAGNSNGYVHDDEDSDASDHGEDNGGETVLAFQDDLTTGTICLGLYKDYVIETWEPRHGWREFYQNWFVALAFSDSLFQS